MARRMIRGAALIAALGAMATGCVVEVDFDPFGTDFSVSGEWTVNGETPSAANCAAADIQDVRIVFYDGGSPFFFDDLTFPCEAGSFETGQIFEYGDYTTEWQAVKSTGEVVRGPMLPLVVDAPVMHANLAPADFVTTGGGGGFDPTGTDDSLSADWTINGAAADADLCSAAGIADVDIVLYDENDTAYAEGFVIASAPCANGKYDSRDPGEPGAIIRDGRYRTSIDAVDASGEIIANFRSEFILDTSAVNHAMLMTADYQTATTLKVNFGWDTDSSATMADGTCTEAMVANFSYMLTPMGGANYDEATEITCANSLVWEDIPPGTYSIYVEGANASGAKNWMATCTELVIAEGEFAEYNCSVGDTSGG